MAQFEAEVYFLKSVEGVSVLLGISVLPGWGNKKSWQGNPVRNNIYRSWFIDNRHLDQKPEITTQSEDGQFDLSQLLDKSWSS